jgi:hypothetical protein
MPPYLTQSVYFPHVVLLETQGVATFFITHSQKSWVILLNKIHKPNRVMYDVSK